MAVAVLGSLPLRDGDLWWQMAYGRYMLENTTLVPDHTIFSWSKADGSLIYCAWLPEIVLYLMYLIGRLPILYAFRYFCFLIFVLAVGVYARRIGQLRNPFTWFVCLLGFLMAYDSAGVIKPAIFSFVYVTLITLIWFWLKSGGRGSPWISYLFPVVALFWVNSHGTIMFGASYLLLIWFGETVNSLLSPEEALTRTTQKHLFFAMVLSAVAITINPYGLEYLRQLVDFGINPKMSELNTVADYRTIFSEIGKERNYLFSLLSGCFSRNAG